MERELEIVSQGKTGTQQQIKIAPNLRKNHDDQQAYGTFQKQA
jgi:GrpB-like predicted nucleotidyltransferase (UPF0157 family)